MVALLAFGLAKTPQDLKSGHSPSPEAEVFAVQCRGAIESGSSRFVEIEGVDSQGESDPLDVFAIFVSDRVRPDWARLFGPRIDVGGESAVAAYVDGAGMTQLVIRAESHDGEWVDAGFEACPQPARYIPNVCASEDATEAVRKCSPEVATRLFETVRDAHGEGLVPPAVSRQAPS